MRAAAAPLVVGVADNGQVLTEPDDGWTVSGVNDTQTISDPLYDRSIVSAASGLLDDDKDRRIAALEAELAGLKPMKVEWPWTRENAARLLAYQLNDMIEDGLISLNRERAGRGLSPFSLEQMEKLQPGWYAFEKDRLLDEAVAALDKYANPPKDQPYPARNKMVMLNPNGDRVQFALEPGIGNYKGGGAQDPYILRQKAKGFKEIEPQPCPRWDCWKPSLAAYQGYCGPFHLELELMFQGQRTSGVTTSAEFSR